MKECIIKPVYIKSCTSTKYYDGPKHRVRENQSFVTKFKLQNIEELIRKEEEKKTEEYKNLKIKRAKERYYTKFLQTLEKRSISALKCRFSRERNLNRTESDEVKSNKPKKSAIEVQNIKGDEVFMVEGKPIEVTMRISTPKLTDSNNELENLDDPKIVSSETCMYSCRWKEKPVLFIPKDDKCYLIRI